MPDSVGTGTFYMTSQTQKIIAYGESALPILVNLFTNNDASNNRFRCERSFLTKGEIAIIIADLIEPIPYTKVTGALSCDLDFCTEHSVSIANYLPAIKTYGTQNFQKKYRDWLNSPERKAWTNKQKRILKKERKKEVQKCWQKKKTN
ncbi:hypothetical protein [Maribacter sp. 2-571]|uniref:hypothetical protein n=1 Tax=Maribacter sp. 2-571 TaxID=3417569 RepID=UPI003D33B7C2